MAGQPVGRRNWKLETRNSKLETRDWKLVSSFQFMCSAALVCAILLFSFGPGLSKLGRLFGYNPEQDDVNNAPVADKWETTPIHWQIDPTIGSNVHTTGGATVQTAVNNAFNAWQSAQVNGQTLTNIAFTKDPNTSQTDPDSSDCLNTVLFASSSKTTFPMGVIAFTDVAFTSVPSGVSPPITYDCTTPPTMRMCNLDACIVDADIVFNPGEAFSTTTPTLSGDFDVQSTVTHEIGHLLGLDHSGIANAIMYPFGDTTSTGQPRVLAIDDAVGVAFLYPSSNFASATGTISGQVTLSGSGIFAAHVIAIDAASGNAVVDGLTDTSGKYNLVGVPPGNYDVLALPLVGIYDLSHFGGWACGYESVNSPPCCDPTEPTCNGTELKPPTNYTGKFH